MTLDRDFETWMRRVLDNGHRARPDADAPPTDMWQQVLTKAQLNPSKEENMHTGILVSPIAEPSARRMHPADRKKGVGHYLNLAVTIALIVAVGAAGWFATSQINQPGDEDPPFAIMSATPSAEVSPELASATCDVQPLSTDRVMEIVKNPSRFMTNGAAGVPSENAVAGSSQSAELWVADTDLEIVGESSEPTEEQFDEASEVANEYLNCLVYGTQAQIWTFYSPVMLQQKILAEFPVFAEESLVRERVEELSTQPAYQAEYLWVEALSINTGPLGGPPAFEFDTTIGLVSVNPELRLTRMHQSESSYYTHVLSIGIEIQDQEGEQIVLTNGLGNSIPQNVPVAYVQIAKLRSGDGWVIIPWPSEKELGWNLEE